MVLEVIFLYVAEFSDFFHNQCFFQTLSKILFALPFSTNFISLWPTCTIADTNLVSWILFQCILNFSYTTFH